MLEPILWLALIELIGALALPVTFGLFRFLPERGYTLAKPLGLLASAYLVWLLSMFGLPFSATTCWVVLFGLFLVLDGWLLVRQGGKLWAELRGWLSSHLVLVIVAELIFLIAYAYLVNLRSYMPDIRDQEKFGDFAFLQSLTLNTKMPPADPWMSGYPINYYYFSHFMMAMLTKMTGIAPAIAFNLTIPLIFAMTALASFGIVFNLVTLARKKPGVVVPIIVGLAGLAMVCLLGNMDAVRQIFFPRGPYETGIQNFSFYWWSPSRVIYDNMPIPDGAGYVTYQWSETINEFPMFSFLLADMHPHVMTLPTALLAVALALNTWLVPAGSPYMNWRRSEGWLLFWVSALVIGSLYFLNTWDYPTYLILIVLASFWRARRVRYEEESGPRWFEGAIWRWVGRSAALLVASLVLVAPFILTFVSLVGDNYVPDPIGSIPVLNTIAKNISFVAWDRTPLLGYFLVFGVFLFPLLSFLAVKVWPYLREPYAYLDGQPTPPLLRTIWSFPVTLFGLMLLVASELGFFLLKPNPLITIFIGLVAAPVLAIGLATITLEYLSTRRSNRPTLELLGAATALALAMILGGWLLHFELYGPLLIAAILIGLLLWFETRPTQPLSEIEAEVEAPVRTNLQSTVYSPGNPSGRNLQSSDVFVLAMCLLPVVITFGTELILIRDIFNSRLNTLFKFYYQAWVLFGLGAAYASWRLLAWLWQRSPFNQTEEDSKDLFTEPVISPAQPVVMTRPTPQVALRLRPAVGLAGGSNLAFSAGVLGGNGLPSPSYDRDYDLGDTQAEAAEDYLDSRPRRPWWRWLWALALSLFLLGGLVYPLFAPYEKSGHYAKRVGLDGSIWLRDGGATGPAMPADYAAIQWLQKQIVANPNFYGTILEAPGWDWIDYARISTFTGMPTLLGWRGHEDQWRGGKAAPRADSFECWQVVKQNGLLDEFAHMGVLPPDASKGPIMQRDEPACRQQLMETMYRTTDAALAQKLLQQTGVRYVYVGLIETGQSNARDNNRQADPNRQYSPVALAKFSQFMKVIYQQDGVTIYSF